MTLSALALPLLATAYGAPRYTDQPTSPSPKGPAVAKAAEDYLAGRRKRTYSDCSGMVHASLDAAGVSPNPRLSSAGMWDLALEEGRVHYNRPSPGDIAFFDDTYDKNGDGRMNDPKTHVAVVVRVLDDGTIEMINAGVSKGTAPLRMNLHHPDLYMQGQTHLNDHLASRGYGPKDRPTLAGQLWAGFAHPQPRGGAAVSAAPRPTPPPVVAAAPEAEPTPPEPSRRARRQARREARREDAPAARPAKVDPATRKVLDGEPLSAWDLTDADCEALWRLRNTVFARHGYVFTSDKAEAWFEAQAWYRPNRRDPDRSPDEYLTAADHANVALLLAREEAQGCR